FSPVPDAVLEYALGAQPSRVGVFTIAGGVLGCVSGLGLAIRTSLEWPLMTGGKPIVSMPAFLLIGYETTILFGALATLLGFLLLARLPRRPPPFYDPRFSADHFGVLVTAGSPDEALLARELLSAGAVEVRVA
ncbi:MAG TPA: quinol:electron acceptor oxidoreductase subunit ActD, partial [Planctomycetota bacterium]|nr:quinol:electron acceptor oxidoreductase subunit ActD [Planctomycetota bacterium]